MIYDQNKYDYLRQYYTAAQIDRYCGRDPSKLEGLWFQCQPQFMSIKDIVEKFNDSDLLLVDSPDGFVPVVDVQKKHKIKMYHILTENGRNLICSYDHYLQKHDSEWIYAQNLQLGDQLIVDSGIDKVVAVVEQPESDTYDLEVGHENHRYYTNGITSHNSGKSLILQNLAVSFIKQGLNVVYLSLELSEDLCAMRIDSMISGISTREIFSKMDDVEIKLAQTARKSGKLHIKQLPQGTTVNDIRAYLKHYELEVGARCDVLIVDYLDLLFPNNKKIDLSNLNIVGKFITEELRGLGVEKDINIQTASQLNRSAVNSDEHDHSHIAGGISKIQTADNVISIFSTAGMKDRGQYQFQFLKTRSSSGVGSKITMGYDQESLRIYDLEEGDAPPVKTAADMMADLRRRNQAPSGESSDKKPDQARPDPVKSVATLQELTKLIRR